MKNFKKTRLIKIFSLLLTVVLTVGGMSVPIEASTSSQIKAEQAALEKEQEELQAKIDALASDKESALEYQRAIEEKITAVQDRILAINESVRTLDVSIVVAEAEIVKASEKYSETIALLQERIKALYMAGDLGTLEIVLNASSVADFADRALFLENMTEYDQSLLNELEQYMIETEDVRNELQEQKELVAELKKEQDIQMIELEELEAENAEAISVIENDAEYIAAQLAEGEKDMDILAEELAEALKKEEEANNNSNSGSSGDSSGGSSDSGSSGDSSSGDSSSGDSSSGDSSSGDTSSGGSSSDDSSSDNSSNDTNSDFPLVWPCPGYSYISSYWGDNRGHKGIDFAASFGTPIYAAESGTVITSNTTNSWGGGWGYYVSIKHNGTYQTLYAHCSSIVVSAGQTVKAGQLIGYVGSTGNSTGNHLHFELYKNGTRIDPWPYLT